MHPRDPIHLAAHPSAAVADHGARAEEYHSSQVWGRVALPRSSHWAEVDRALDEDYHQWASHLHLEVIVQQCSSEDVTRGGL